MPALSRLATATVGALSAVVLFGALAGCAAEPDARAVVDVRAAAIASVADLSPAADEDVVLSVERAGGETVTLSIAQLDQLRTVSATLREPFLHRDVTFEGVPLRDLFDFLEIPADVTSLHTVALNEYEVTLPVSIADDDGAILATRADGELIGVDEGGPTRVVMTGDHPDVRDESLWIWSLKTVTVP